MRYDSERLWTFFISATYYFYHFLKRVYVVSSHGGTCAILDVLSMVLLGPYTYDFGNKSPTWFERSTF